MFEKVIENGKNSKYYQDFEKIQNALSFYRDYVHPMSDDMGNDFRHIAGSARMTQLYNPLVANVYGLGKEFEDYFIKHKSGKDSLHDIKNNLYGSIIGQAVKNAPQQTLYEWVVKGLEK